MAVIDTSVSNITTGYDGANALAVSGLGGATAVMVWNETSDNIGVSIPSGSACDVSNPDHFIAPATNGVTAEWVSVNKIICLRSLSGSTINSGNVYVSTW